MLLKPGYLRSGINDDGGNVRRRSVYDMQIVRVRSLGVLQRIAALCDYTSLLVAARDLPSSEMAGRHSSIVV